MANPNKKGRDHLSAEDRSRNMSKIKNKDTKPETILRSLLHRAGFRFRKNVANLPGRPDIVLPKYKTVIFLHGCYWHRHDCKRGRSVPSTRQDFWLDKFSRNMIRDQVNQKLLVEQGWNVIIVWECELKELELLKSSLVASIKK